MYKRKIPIASPCGNSLSSYDTSENIARPFSYYVLGGIDISGESLRMDASTEFDNDSDIDSFQGVETENLSPTDVVSPFNPRTSVFDMVELTGVGAYDDYQKGKTSSSTSASSEQSSKSES